MSAPISHSNEFVRTVEEINLPEEANDVATQPRGTRRRDRHACLPTYDLRAFKVRFRLQRRRCGADQLDAECRLCCAKLKALPARLQPTSLDTNGDGSPDLLWWNSSTGEVSRWLLSGTTVTSYGGDTAEVTDTTWQPTAIR